MIKKQWTGKRAAGFTLLETVIYIGLFSLMFTGIFVSIYPLFSSADRLTKNIAVEGESAFILAKINYALSSTITSSSGTITTPSAGNTANELVIKYGGVEKYHFALDTSNTYCTSPLVCTMLTVSKNGGTALPLNAQRVKIENFSVTHVAPANGEPRYLDVKFTAGGVPVGPIRYYVHF